MIIISNPINLTEIFRDLYQVKADNAGVEMHTGDTDETLLKTYTIPAGALGVNGVLRIKATGVSRGNNGNKTYRLRLGGLGGTLIAFTIITPQVVPWGWTLFAALHNLGAVDSQGWSILWVDNLTVGLNKIAFPSAINTANAQDLVITGQLVDAADECEVDDWTIEINPT